MKRTFYPLLVSLVTCAAGSLARADDALSIPLGAPPPSPTTLWNFLGIPQGINQVRDARTNRLGNNPDAERQMPLKRIADPDNLKSKNPAIAAAAKIKADQDDAQQKIKAIKFLAQTGCCCPANKDVVKDALLASLDDCTEAVRYEAAKALCAVAGACATCSTCPGQVSCPKCTCCTADVMNKLNEVANGTTPEGCPIEPSQRVRCAAANALEQCRRARGPTTEVAPEQPQQEVPLERRATVPPPETSRVPVQPVVPVKPVVPPKQPAVPKPPVSFAPGAVEPGMAVINESTTTAPGSEPVTESTTVTTQPAPGMGPGQEESHEPMRDVRPNDAPDSTSDGGPEAYIRISDHPEKPVKSATRDNPVSLQIKLASHEDAAAPTSRPATELQPFVGPTLDVSAQPIIGVKRPVAVEDRAGAAAQPRSGDLVQPRLSWLDEESHQSLLRR